MAKKRFCNYCLGAARVDTKTPRHPVLPYNAPTRAHVDAFRHSGRSCPHLKLHKEIWRLCSHKFYGEFTSLISEAGLGPGALINVSHRLPAQIYRPWDRMAVVTGVDFEADALYGLDNGYNYMLKISEEAGDYLFNWPHGMTLYIWDVLANHPSIDKARNLAPQIHSLAKQRLTSLDINHRGTKGRFSFDCWNEPSTWQINYELQKKSTFEIEVLQPAKLHVPPPLDDLNYNNVIRTIRKQGSFLSREFRFYHA